MRSGIASLAVTLLLVGAGCKTFRSSEDPVAREQEIVRDIAWRLSHDKRFDEVLVRCKVRDVYLGGRVTTREAAEDAVKIAAATRDVANVINQIEVRPK